MNCLRQEPSKFHLRYALTKSGSASLPAIPADDSIAILELKSTIPPSTKELSLTYRNLKVINS